MFCRQLVLLIATLAVIAAEDPAAKERLQWEAGVDKIAGSWDALVDQSQSAWWGLVEPADEKALTDLERLATQAGRRGDQALMVSAWREVLYLEPDHEAALAFFDAIGTRAEVVAELSARREAEAASLTGDAGTPAEELNRSIVRILETRSNTRDKASARYHDRLNDGRVDAERDLKTLRDRSLRSISSQAGRAQRRGDVVASAALWKLALEIDPTHEEAVAFFTGLNTLDKVLEELGEPDPILASVPPLEAVPTSSGSGPVDLDGVSILIVGSLHPVGIELLEEAGAGVDEISVEPSKKPRVMRAAVIAALEEHDDTDVIIIGMVGGRWATGVVGAQMLRRSDVPVLLAGDHATNLQVLRGAGAIPRKSFNGQGRSGAAVPTDHPLGRKLPRKARFDFKETDVRPAAEYPAGVQPVVVGEKAGYPFVFTMDATEERSKLLSFGLPTDVEDEQAEALEALWLASVAWAACGH